MSEPVDKSWGVPWLLVIRVGKNQKQRVSTQVILRGQAEWQMGQFFLGVSHHGG